MKDKSATPARGTSSGGYTPPALNGARSNPKNVAGPRRQVHRPLGRKVKTSEHEDI